MQMVIKSFFILRSVVGRAEHHGADAMQPPTPRKPHPPSFAHSQQSAKSNRPLTIAHPDSIEPILGSNDGY
jgi:hypothetical protein